MPMPQSICLEFMSSDAARYVRCVAVGGGEPGLAVDANEEVLWMVPGGAFELWISADERLVLRRLEGAPPMEVHRSGRQTEIPVGKPVILLDQDEVRWNDRKVRVHFHGIAREIHPPQRLLGGAMAAGLAAALLVGGTGCDRRSNPPVERKNNPPEPTNLPVEIRIHPPLPPLPPESNPGDVTDVTDVKILNAVPARFPITARQMKFQPNQEHRVTVKVFVDPTGKPRRSIIVEGVPGSYGFDEEATNAIMASTFAPKMQGGKPLAGWFTKTFVFPKQNGLEQKKQHGQENAPSPKP